MGNSTNRQSSEPCELENDKAVDNTDSANRDLTIDNPDSSLQEQGTCKEREEVYVQVTVFSKKLRTEEDGTIILSPISESHVSCTEVASYSRVASYIISLTQILYNSPLSVLP